VGVKSPIRTQKIAPNQASGGPHKSRCNPRKGEKATIHEKGKHEVKSKRKKDTLFLENLIQWGGRGQWEGKGPWMGIKW